MLSPYQQKFRNAFLYLNQVGVVNVLLASEGDAVNVVAVRDVNTYVPVAASREMFEKRDFPLDTAVRRTSRKNK